MSPAPGYRFLVMNSRSRRTIRATILVASVLLTLCAVGLIAAVHIHGNHALGEDGSSFQLVMSVGMSVLFCGGTLLLGVILCNCRDLLGPNFRKVAFGGAVLLLLCEVATFFWLRAGLEASMASRDGSHAIQAAETAWAEIEARLQGDVATLQAAPVATVPRADAEALRLSIADLVERATSMDNDGKTENDREIPGVLARIESLRADLANAEDRIAREEERHANTVAGAVAALAAHRATRADVLGANAGLLKDRHQFARWADDLAAAFPSLSAPAALQCVLALVALSLMVPQYAGLAGITAALAIPVEPIQAEAPAALPPPPPSGRKRRGSGPVIDAEPIPKHILALNRDECKRIVYQLRDHAGLPVQLDVSRSPVHALRAVIAEAGPVAEPFLAPRQLTLIAA